MDFYSLTAQQFEDICFEYTCQLYSKYEHYNLKHTRFRHDGGRDIEITFYDEISHFKIWAECKRHTNNIGLEEIGKNVVLVISKHVNKLIFFSASDITRSAMLEISKIGEYFGFEVTYLYGDKLKDALKQYPDLVRSYFPDEPCGDITSANILNVSFSVSEFERDIIIPADTLKPVILREGRLINIYIQLQNWSDNVYDSIAVRLVPPTDDIYFLETIKYVEMVMPKTDRLVLFKGQIANQQKPHIPMPDVVVTLKEKKSSDKINKSYSLPMLDTSKCRKYPLIGKKMNEFLGKANAALEWTAFNCPIVFDIRGISGVGKTRLSAELAAKFIVNGYESIKVDCMDHDGFSVIRAILCRLLNLPFYKGQINYTKENVISLIQAAGGSSDFQNIISDFLVKNKMENGDFYYLTDAFLYYLLHPAGKNKVIVTIDNLQVLEPKLLDLFSCVLDGLNNCSGNIVIILITNTERVVKHNLERISSYQDFLDNKAKEYPKTFFKYECAPFKEKDAALLLMHLFKISNIDSPVITEFLKKSGYIPFEIMQFLEYLNDREIIEWIDDKTWHIKKRDEYFEFLQGCPVFYKDIIKERLKYWKIKYSPDVYGEFKNTVSAIICFQGQIPYSYLYYLEIDDNMIELMQESSWITQSDKGITFFHDNIYYYFKENAFFCKNIPVLQKVLSTIDLVDTQILPDYQKKFMRFFCRYHLGQLSDALILGLELMSECNNAESRKSALEAGEILFADKTLNSNELTRLKIGIAYADIIFGLGNKDRGCSIYVEILPLLLKYTGEISSDYLFGHLHKIANAQLQLAYYNDAVNTLNLMKVHEDIPEKYRFIIENRFGVAYTCLGDFTAAKDHLDQSVQIAENMQSDFWKSTAYSDLALLNFYNYKIDDIEKRSALVKENLENALQLFHCDDHNPAYRIVEMEWHKAIMSIIDGDYNHAYEFSCDCILAGQKNDQLYGQVRGYNLKALACLLDNRKEEAVSILSDCLHMCEVYHFSSGIFRMYNNIGVLYALNDKMQMAEECFRNALNVMGYNRLEIKQFPVILNAILVSCLQNNYKQIRQMEEICNQIHSDDLLEYKVNLVKTLHAEQVPQNMSFWTFEGFGYIF